MKTLNELDVAVLSRLQESQYLDINYKKLAQDLKRLNVTESQIKTCITRLEEAGVICGRSAIVDAEELGFITVFIRFKCYDPLETTIPKLEALRGLGTDKGFTVQEAFIITGDLDIQLKVKVRGLDGYKAFIRIFEDTIERIGLALGSGSIGFEKLWEELSLDTF